MNDPEADLQSVANIDLLPPMPATAKEIVDTFANDLISLDEISNVISRDPAVSSRILGLANSAFFAVKKEILTVNDAIIGVLGLDLTRGVAIGIACADAFDTSACPRFDVKQFWQSSLVASALALQLSKRLKTTTEYSAECAFTGLLHGLGYLRLASTNSPQFNDLLATDAPDKAILDYYGVSQDSIALTVAQAWALPTCVQFFFEASLTSCDQDPQHRLIEMTIHISAEIAAGKPMEPLIDFALESVNLDTSSHRDQLSKAMSSALAAAASCT